VYTRDLSFVRYAAKRGGNKSLKTCLEQYQRNAEASVHPVLNIESDAWPRLREAMANGKVSARGIPSDNEEPPGMAAEEQLPPREAAVVVPGYYWFGKMYLRPETWQFNEGLFWHDVKIARNDLEKHFPETESAAAEVLAAAAEASIAASESPAAAAESPAQRPRDHLLQATANAIRKIYGPNGPGFGVKKGQWHAAVVELMTKDGLQEPSESTLRRALDTLRTEHD
jgi:hypothetical protein